MRRAHCGVMAPSESRAQLLLPVGKLVEYPMEADSMEAYITSMEVN